MNQYLFRVDGATEIFEYLNTRGVDIQNLEKLLQILSSNPIVYLLCQRERILKLNSSYTLDSKLGSRLSMLGKGLIRLH